MTPPQLSADAPVLNVLKPSVVYLLKPFWHNLDVTAADGLQESEHWASMQSTLCSTGTPRLLKAELCDTMMSTHD